MILFGAGSSVPFGIPGMLDFTTEFLETKEYDFELVEVIRDAIESSDQTIGLVLPFDLESLLSVLTDLSEIKPQKPISAATVALLLRKKLTIKKARTKYKDGARSTYSKLNEFIFNTCMRPIKEGKKKGDLSFFNKFYGPLITILNGDELREIKFPAKEIFSTNWDLCFKFWADNVNLPLKEWIETDQQSNQFLKIEIPFRKREPHPDFRGFRFTPLHGSLDLFRRKRYKKEGIYEEISKMPDADVYLSDRPEEIENIFIIYPLEAIGYEETVKSPYLDLLSHFKLSLKQSSIIFIIGYSLRDPTIGSIMEEAVGEKIRNRSLTPLSSDLEKRKDQAKEDHFKIIIINPTPQKLAENLKKQYSTNLLNTFIPVKISFPKVDTPDFNKKYSEVLLDLLNQLQNIGYLTIAKAEELGRVLNLRYGIEIDENKFRWKPKR